MKPVTIIVIIAVFGSMIFVPTDVDASFHLWDINEIYSNSDGTQQFIELITTANGQQFLTGHKLTANSDGILKTYTWTNNSPSPTSNTQILLATPILESASEFPTPDFIIPNNFFNPTANTITFNLGEGSHIVTLDNGIPSDGLNSIDDNGVIQTATPTNFSGQTATPPFVFDPTAPVVTQPTSPTNDQSPTISGTASEDGGTITLSSTIDDTLAPTATVEGGTWSINLSSVLTEDTHSITATHTDAAGNVSSASGGKTLVIDLTGPTTTISSTESSPTNADPIPMTITFSDAAITLTEGEISVTNGSVTTSSLSTSDNTIYTFTVDPTSDGTVSVNVAADVVTDGIGNNNQAATQFDITFDGSDPTAPGTVSGTVFADTNDNGIQDGVETGIAGVTVVLVDGSGTQLPNAITDVDGTYTFTGVAPGTILVQVAPVPTLHLPATGFNSFAFPILAADETLTQDFPLVPVTVPATVTGTVFADTNNNGVQDPGELGLEGVTVFVVDFLTLTQILPNPVTDADGVYTANGVLPDTVLVQAAPIPDGFLPSTGHNTFAFPALVPGVNTINFPLAPVAPADEGTIIIDVFNDANSNGIKDAGEGGVEGAVVFTFELLNAVADVQVTGEFGVTTHTGLIPDIVLAQINAVVLPAGFTTITTSNAGFEFIAVTAGSTTTVEIGLAP